MKCNIIYKVIYIIITIIIIIIIIIIITIIIFIEIQLAALCPKSENSLILTIF